MAPQDQSENEKKLERQAAEKARQHRQDNARLIRQYQDELAQPSIQTLLRIIGNRNLQPTTDGEAVLLTEKRAASGGKAMMPNAIHDVFMKTPPSAEALAPLHLELLDALLGRKLLPSLACPAAWKTVCLLADANPQDYLFVKWAVGIHMLNTPDASTTFQDIRAELYQDIKMLHEKNLLGDAQKSEQFACLLETVTQLTKAEFGAMLRGCKGKDALIADWRSTAELFCKLRTAVTDSGLQSTMQTFLENAAVAGAWLKPVVMRSRLGKELIGQETTRACITKGVATILKDCGIKPSAGSAEITLPTPRRAEIAAKVADRFGVKIELNGRPVKQAATIADAVIAAGYVGPRRPNL